MPFDSAYLIIGHGNIGLIKSLHFQDRCTYSRPSCSNMNPKKRQKMLKIPEIKGFFISVKFLSLQKKPAGIIEYNIITSCLSALAAIL